MKKVLILGRKNIVEKNNPEILARAIGNESSEIEVTSGYYEDIILSISAEGAKAFLIQAGSKQLLDEFSTIVFINWTHDHLYADFAHSLALIADRAGVTVWNKELVSTRSGTKVSQLVRLSFEGLELPTTLFSLQSELLKNEAGVVGFPFVAKDPLASRGRNNYLCSSWEDFLQKADAKSSYILQTYIPNDKSDLRMFVAGGDPALAILRKGDGSGHLNNVSQGASAELVELDELPQELIENTKMIAKHFQRELCGIDFMKNSETGGYVFLEINTIPQIVNGVFAEEKARSLARILERS